MDVEDLQFALHTIPACMGSWASSWLRRCNYARVVLVCLTFAFLLCFYFMLHILEDRQVLG